MEKWSKWDKQRAAEMLLLIGYMAFLAILMFKLFGQLDTYHKQIDKALGVSQIAAPA